jgi:hypothetical protein
MIYCYRIGFHGTDDDGYDGPETALQEVLRRIEGRGCEVVSVSVSRSTRRLRGTQTPETYEAFIVYRTEEKAVAPADSPPPHPCTFGHDKEWWWSRQDGYSPEQYWLCRRCGASSA